MARKNIPLADKELVKQRLAQGASTRQAIEGTSIASPNTANLITHQEKDNIGRLREDYLKLIEKNGADAPKRAQTWSDMAEATKIHSSLTEPDRKVPDWQAREKALKYIDSLAGITVEQKSGVFIGIGLTKKEYDY